jgi:hypothetical protein
MASPLDSPSQRPLRGALIPLVLVALALLGSLSADFRASSETRLDAAAERAIAAFAVARTINAVISVVQETEIGVSIGINTTLGPGQILDPLNDLIERFSTAALIAATLLWALKLAGGFVLLPWLPLCLAGLLLLRFAIPRGSALDAFDPMLMRAVRVGLVVWAFSATTPWLIDSVHHSDVVQQHYAAATRDLENAGRELGDMAQIESPWDIDRASLRESIRTLTSMADNLSRQAIVVLAVFVFEVLLLPILIFWIGTRLLLPPRAAA